MKALGLLSSAVAVVCVLAYFLLDGSTPSFVIPLAVASAVLGIFLILVADLLGRRAQNRKTFHCVQCGKKMTARNIKKAGSICPACGSTVFA
jgi:DNA-directed RNA polymerase subunit RPC12/RpoP